MGHREKNKCSYKKQTLICLEHLSAILPKGQNINFQGLAG